MDWLDENKEIPPVQINRYQIHNPTLNMVAEFIWHLTSDTAENIDGKLLPVVIADLIINLSDLVWRSTFHIRR